ncbi:M13 family peptidase [Prolixibacteraceae bacterium JC049]|nr:M13 family peptidase [Prolixibacteraceae bacterium JC049]
MDLKKGMSILVLAAIMGSCQTHKVQTNDAIKKADMDLSVNPADDFDNYANGGWKKNNPIPEDKARYGSFDELADLGQKQVRDLVKELAHKQHEVGSIGQKIADFYNSGMDTELIEKEGLKALKPYYDKIAAVKNNAQLQALIAEFHKMSVPATFAAYSSADSKNSSMEIAYLSQGGLGMPDRDYYVNDDDRSKTLRAAYVKHLTNIFQLLGDSPKQAQKSAATVMALETRMAKASMTRLERRDPHKCYNKMDLAALAKKAPNFNWKNYFNAMGIGDPGQLIVRQPEFVAEISKMVKEVKIADWKTYLRWQFTHDISHCLGKAFVDENFEFYGKTMSGQQQQRPRWKRVLGSVNGSLGEALGQMYVKKHFPPEAKERMQTLVANLKAALGERIANLEWMSAETKVKAKEKLATMRTKIGYPDKWRDYSNLEVTPKSYAINVLNAQKFNKAYNLSKVNKPVDKSQWFMPPQMVNAYYHPLLNEIVFPAAILQPPFFYINADDAVNYGAIGVVIGHEMTHGFDDKGRLYDKDGNLNDWWTKEDAERFDKRAQVLVDQFNEFKVLGDTPADGKLSLGENIADLGGLNISYTAFQKVKNDKDVIEGFTPDQRFFLAYSHVWAQNIRDKEILRRTKEDVHSLGRFRVIGPLRNLPEFHKAFDIKAGTYMFLPTAERAIIW